MSDPQVPGSIAADLAAIAADVGAVSKTRDADAGAGGSYKFRGIDDVMNAVHPAFAEHGVTIVMEDTDVTFDVVERGNRGSKWRHWLVTTRYHFIARDGSALRCTVTSEALDNQDKGIGKAHSYGLKDALCRLLTLPTDDPHQDNEAADIPDATGPEMIGKAKAKGELVAALHGDTTMAAEVWPFGEARFVSRDDLDDLIGRVSSPVQMAGEDAEEDGSSSEQPDVELAPSVPPEAGDEERTANADASPATGPSAARAALRGERT